MQPDSSNRRRATCHPLSCRLPRTHACRPSPACPYTPASVRAEASPERSLFGRRSAAGRLLRSLRAQCCGLTASWYLADGLPGCWELLMPPAVRSRRIRRWHFPPAVRHCCCLKLWQHALRCCCCCCYCYCRRRYRPLGHWKLCLGRCCRCWHAAASRAIAAP